MKRVLLTSALALAACAVAVVPANAAPAAPAATSGTAVYSASPATLPANLPSLGAEASAFSEIGDQVTLTGSSRTLSTVSVTMSSWACQDGSWNTNDCLSAAGSKYNVPITVTLYEAGTAQTDGTVLPGDVITRATKTFAIPYRPTANVRQCRGANLGKWYDTATATCYNGKAASISYNFGSLGITVPDTFVVGIAYNTSDSGKHPLGDATACHATAAGCAYDSLNVGLSPVRVGSKQYPGAAFQNTTVDNNLCDATAVTGKFNLDSPTNACWGTDYNPAITITATGGAA